MVGRFLVHISAIGLTVLNEGYRKFISQWPKCGDVVLITPRLRAFTSLTFHCLLIIPSVDAASSMQLKASLNRPGMNE